MNNLEIRKQFANKLVGEQVEVQKIGYSNPSGANEPVMYLPIPEYGICLIKRYPQLPEASTETVE